MSNINSAATSNEPYVTVIGGVNIDIEAKSFAELIPKDSNPGKVSTALGGVGFNIARNIGLLGTKVMMLTALGDDSDRIRIDNEAKRFNIDLSRALTIPDSRNQTYLYICGPDGDMELAVSDMDLLHSVDCAYIEKQLDIINASAAVVVDANLDPETLEYIAANCTVPIFADPVSITKAVRMKNILGSLYAFKPNLIEGEFLSNVIISDEDSMRQAASKLNDIGIKHLFLSLGKHGVCCSSVISDENAERDITAAANSNIAPAADTGHAANTNTSPAANPGYNFFKKPCLVNEINNATGGGDAMMAAIVKGYLLGLSDENTAALALAASAMAVECPHTVNFDITLDKVLERAGLNLS